MNNKVGRPKLADSKLKKKSIITIVLLIVFIAVYSLIGYFLVFNGNSKLLKGSSSNCDEKCEYRNKVSAVAKQYLYKQRYTNYEQHSMADDFAFRNINVLPSEASKTNKLNFDCSSFVANVYAVATGFTFEELFRDDASSDYSYKFHNLGMGPKAKYYVNAAKRAKKNKTDVYVYYIELKGNETENKKNEIYKKLFGDNGLIKNGDVYATVTTEADGKTHGHAMLYTENVTTISPDKDGKTYNNQSGFIHSTGVDYDEKAFKDGKYNEDEGYYDRYSVRFISKEDFKNSRFFFESKPKTIAVIRPINYITKNRYSKFKRYDKNNVDALTTLKRYSFDSYIVKDKEYFTKYNSVKKGDTISNRLEINKITETGSDKLVVKTKLPSGVEFVSCSNEPCEYNSSNRTVTWQNENNKNVSYRLYKTKGASGRYTVTVKVTTSSDITFNNFEINKLGSSKIYKMSDIKVLANNKTDKLDPKYVKNNFVSSLFDKSGNVYKIKKSANNDIYKHLVPGLYGGRKLSGNTLGNRSNWFRVGFLDEGDIVVTYDNGNTNYYVYKGNNLFDTEDKKSVNLKRYIEVVMSRDLYAVIRP